MTTMTAVPRILSPLSLALATLVFTATWAMGADPTAPATPTGLDLAAETGSLTAALAKVLGALAVVIGLMVLLVYWIRKLGLGQMQGRAGALIHVLDTRMIAPKKYVAVLQVPGERIVVGVTDQQISFLTSLGNQGETETTNTNEPGPAASTFANRLKTAVAKASRRNQAAPGDQPA